MQMWDHHKTNNYSVTVVSSDCILVFYFKVQSIQHTGFDPQKKYSLTVMD